VLPWSRGIGNGLQIRITGVRIPPVTPLYYDKVYDMTLQELIQTGDYSAYERLPGDFCNYYDTLADILYPTKGIEYDHYEAVEKSGRAHKIVLKEWLCTDQHVGFYLYFVDDQPVCTMYQAGRKCYPEWKFFSEESFHILKNLFDEFEPESTHYIHVPLLNERDMTVQF
jgi:hypothetical protein